MPDLDSPGRILQQAYTSPSQPLSALAGATDMKSLLLLSAMLDLEHDGRISQQALSAQLQQCWTLRREYWKQRNAATDEPVIIVIIVIINMLMPAPVIVLQI
jgi:hypothetical protein